VDGRVSSSASRSRATRITAIDLLADPDLLARLELVVLDD